MNRRELIAVFGCAAAWPAVARAQQPQRLRHVGVLMNVVQGDSSGPAEVEALRQGLMELGWIEGRNIDVEFRWPGGDIVVAKAVQLSSTDAGTIYVTKAGTNSRLAPITAWART
jgi:Fe2+ transport system protein FeoA